MEKIKCPKLDRCPIFLKGVFHNEMIGKTYKNLYCITSGKKYLECKRYLVAEKYGKPAPDNILPNSSLSIDEIAKHMGII